MMPDSVFVIAEAGVNHNGSLDLALQLVEAAAASGADAVKFQTFNAAALVAASAPKAEYQTQTTGEGTQLDMVRRLELDESAHRSLAARASEVGVEFMSAPFDIGSIHLLERLGVSKMKVPSGSMTNVPFLRAIAATGLPTIMSTGMADLAEVELALNVLESAGLGRESITLLHCTTEYPAPFEHVNLRAMQTMREAFGVRVGYSDHTEGIAVPIAAVALGASVIEKHFTLDRSLPGPDHQASLEPAELAGMVTAIRQIESALGSAEKVAGPGESRVALAARGSIVASRHIAAGEVLSEDNLTVKRPGTGVSPFRWDDVIGTLANREYDVDDPIVVVDEGETT